VLCEQTGSRELATVAMPHAQLAPKAPLNRQLKDFGRSVTYQVAGLPIALRGLGQKSEAPEAIIRRAYAHRFWHPRGIAELSRLALSTIVSPLVLLGLEVAFTVKNGRQVARRFGRPVHRQLLDQLRLYVRAGVLPPWYYIFELYRQPHSAFARDFIYRWESKGGVLNLLREERAPRSELNDKARFERHCRKHQVRAVPVLAILRDGEVELRANQRDFATDLFVKPLCGRGGKGAERWDYSTGLYRSIDGRWLTRDELFARLARRSRSVPLLIQPRLVNHEALQGLNNGALSTVRVLTCLNEAREPELVGAAMRMAIGSNRTVDNLHAGGIACAVDLETGVLGPASNLGADSRLGWLGRHPNTGARIEGAQLPMWGDVRKFAVDAHGAFSDRVIVGWDIAITADGPMLVEGNGSPDLDIMQRFVRHGLMTARLGILLAFHLSQLGLAGSA
jgi:Sugar-transfer associated ATP-grasp